nr:histidine biosynthesis protein HisIE [Pseudoxanthomonas sp. X-1]
MATTKQAKKAPWKKANPAKKSASKTLSSGQKAEAKSRAKKAGRPYPNLVDNMAVAKKTTKKAAKKATKKTAKKATKKTAKKAVKKTTKKATKKTTKQATKRAGGRTKKTASK